MFTLCMSRPSRNKNTIISQPALTNSCSAGTLTDHNMLHDFNQRPPKKQIKGGYLLRYRKGLFCKSWSEEWVVLYDDSTISFYADKGLRRARGEVLISESPDLLAVGEWTRQVPKQPRVPKSCHMGQLLVVGCRSPKQIHWLMAKSCSEVDDWMTAISNTLPPPPELTVDEKRRRSLSLSAIKDVKQTPDNIQKLIPSYMKLPPQYPVEPPLTNGSAKFASAKNHPASLHSSFRTTVNRNISERVIEPAQVRRYDNEHTVLSGVAIDWGHAWGQGWGWNQAFCAAHAACSHDVAINTMYCHTADDYTLSGYETMDWSSFADFCF